MGGKGSGRKSNHKPTTTNYALSYKSFRSSEEYKRIYMVLQAKGIVPPYVDNIIYRIFTAGWNATGTKIVIVGDQ